jgi:hypothetical protein
MLLFKILLLCQTVGLFETIKFLPMSIMPAADMLINTDKAFMLERVGAYSSKLKEEIIHSFIPLHDLCHASSSTEICLFLSQATPVNILELSTILPSRDTVTALPRYDDDQVSSIIRGDISQLIRTHTDDVFITKTNSIVSYFDSQFHLPNAMKKSALPSTRSLQSSNYFNIPRVSISAYRILLTQITNNKIGFDFLTNPELMSLLTATMSAVDKSYRVNDLYESLAIFSQLIVGQSTCILRSCIVRQGDIASSQPCLVVSTVFLRPSPQNSNTPTVYRFISLPVSVNKTNIIYSKMPAAIGINTDEQSVLLWNNLPEKNECLFSTFVYCQTQPVSIQLSNSPCLLELLSDDTHITASCQIERFREIQTEVMDLENNLWLFSNIDAPVYCQLTSNVDQFKSIISINEPSIVRIPCDNAVKCDNIEFSSTSCTQRSIYIKSTNMRKYEEMSSIQWSTTDMTKQLVSTYKRTLRTSFDDIFNDSKDNQLSATKIFKEFGVYILSTLLLLIISIVSFFIKWIKYMVKKRLDKLERDLDDVIHRLA